jgi:phosphoglycerol geranylgeranyltransferase
MLIDDLLTRTGRVLHFTLFDPDRQTLDELARRAKMSERFGTDAALVGGSSSFSPRLLEATVKTLKNAVKLPVILFPNSAAAVSKRADAIFFMSLLNADDPRVLIREQVRAAPFIERIKLCPISMAYIVIGTSRRPTTIERRVKLDKIGPRDAAKAASYALAARYFGMGCTYLEAGSGADRPVPLPMIRAVRAKIHGPLIVGGGIRTAGQARRIAEAGADIIVTGTIAERNITKLRSIIEAIHGARPAARS